ncbi:hypothetical protein LCGC14_1501460 [marine sediment metagenome]|uniref:Uncharacterized protein n=1 Tax=marine sediment metagenome TaxID=412755 RepID=A0A0F9LJQ2_9ZZZZ
MSENTKLHPFERAGLGEAPFRCIGVEIKRYQACHGAPIQPGGMCEFCGESIVECCIIKGSDGRQFTVGNVCVGKTYDAKLVSDTDRRINLLRRNARHQKEAECIERLACWLQDEQIRAKLAAEPSPNNCYSADVLSWAQWMMDNAGNSGKMKVYRKVKKVEAALESSAQ